MGLTVYYDWKIKADAAAARRLIVKLRKLAQELPFDEVSEIYERDAPGEEYTFRRYEGPFHRGICFFLAGALTVKKKS